MKLILVLGSLVGTMAFAGKGPHKANCDSLANKPACQAICQACMTGFPVGDAKNGNGFYADCAGPIVRNGGARQPAKAQALPPPPPNQNWQTLGPECGRQGGMPKGL